MVWMHTRSAIADANDSAYPGFVTPVTYFYPFYFAILLIHRYVAPCIGAITSLFVPSFRFVHSERRDHEKCAAKYGDDWVEYCKKVPYRIVPFIY